MPPGYMDQVEEVWLRTGQFAHHRQSPAEPFVVSKNWLAPWGQSLPSQKGFFNMSKDHNTKIKLYTQCKNKAPIVKGNWCPHGSFILLSMPWVSKCKHPPGS